jgi:hypothetical protein
MVESEIQTKRTPMKERIGAFVRLREEPYRPATRRELLKMIYVNGLWFALVFGFVESIYVFILGNFFSRVLHISPHYFWMIPLIDMLWSLVIGSLFCLLAFWLPKLPWIRIMAFVYTFLGLLTIYYVRPKIGLIAAMILFLGISFQVSLIIGQRTSTFYSMVRRTLPWMGLILLMVMVGAIGYYL